jgi:hypothetical protein
MSRRNPFFPPRTSSPARSNTTAPRRTSAFGFGGGAVEEKNPSPARSQRVVSETKVDQTTRAALRGLGIQT